MDQTKAGTASAAAMRQNRRISLTGRRHSCLAMASTSTPDRGVMACPPPPAPQPRPEAHMVGVAAPPVHNHAAGPTRNTAHHESISRLVWLAQDRLASASNVVNGETRTCEASLEVLCARTRRDAAAVADYNHTRVTHSRMSERRQSVKRNTKVANLLLRTDWCAAASCRGAPRRSAGRESRARQQQDLERARTS